MLNEGMNFIENALQDDNFTVENALSVYNILVERKSVLDSEIGATHYAQGGLIQRLKQTGLWKQFPGVEDWWEFGEFIKRRFDMSLQKAEALRNLYERVQVLQINPSDIQLCGWFLSSEIGRKCKTPEEADTYVQLIRDGKKKTEVMEMLRQAHAVGKVAEPRKYYKRRFDLEEDETNFLDETLEIAAKSVGRSLFENMFPKDALMIIISQWRQLREREAA